MPAKSKTRKSFKFEIGASFPNEWLRSKTDVELALWRNETSNAMDYYDEQMRQLDGRPWARSAAFFATARVMFDQVTEEVERRKGN
jgi:hypothetical protein